MTLIEFFVIFFWLAGIVGAASAMQLHFGWVGVIPGAMLGALAPFMLHRLVLLGTRVLAWRGRRARPPREDA